MSSPIEAAIRQIVEEKGLSYESVMETIEAALAAAYRKDFGNRLQNIEAKFNPITQDLKLWDVKTVVEDQELPEEQVTELEAPERAFADERPLRIEESTDAESDAPRFNPKTEVMLTPAQELQPGAHIGDTIRTPLNIPSAFGRMAAMTAKQVIVQKLREAEREVTYNEYKEHEGEVVTANIQRRQGRVVLVDLGRGTAIMRPEDQVQGERYMPGDRTRVFIKSVDLGMRGPEILVSRAAPELVIELFKVEIPEIADGTVRIDAIAREPGSRSKVAVSCDDNGVDPIGACIGQRGARIQTIIAELGGEKVDIIEFDEDPGVFVMNALSPAKVEHVTLDESSHVATVTVERDQLSLAIGRGGQNVRLAARLTDWRINVAEEGGRIKGSSEGAVDEEKANAAAPQEAKAVRPAVSDDGEEPVAEAVVEETVAEELAEAEARATVEALVEEADGNDDAVDPDDEQQSEAEGADEGLEHDTLPSEEMAAADETAEDIEPIESPE